MKRITILGSTGSIGQSTLDVISRHRDAFQVVALAAGRNCALLERQIAEFGPEVVSVGNEETARDLSSRVKGVEILWGPDGANAVAAHAPADFVISAIVGAAGLIPTVTAIRAGRNIGLANKEALVIAGGIVTEEARRHNVTIIPVDSEHSAVFQCVEGRDAADIRRIILTASGGPFINRTREDLDTIGPDEALRHPNWSMGKKITIDSATLMNKGLEVIEACWLFSIPPDSVDVLIHPQSIVHSMVEFRDRSVLAQLSVPDMRGPIAHALFYPRRSDDAVEGLQLDRIASLSFLQPDHDTFPCLSYAYDAIRAGGTMPAVLNAANETAVHAFLDDRIGFNDIPRIVRRAMDDHPITVNPSLDQLLDADRQARTAAQAMVLEASE